MNPQSIKTVSNQYNYNEKFREYTSNLLSLQPYNPDELSNLLNNNPDAYTDECVDENECNILQYYNAPVISGLIDSCYGRFWGSLFSWHNIPKSEDTSIYTTEEGFVQEYRTFLKNKDLDCFDMCVSGNLLIYTVPFYFYDDENSTTYKRLIDFLCQSKEGIRKNKTVLNSDYLSDCYWECITDSDNNKENKEVFQHIKNEFKFNEKLLDKGNTFDDSKIGYQWILKERIDDCHSKAKKIQLEYFRNGLFSNGKTKDNYRAKCTLTDITLLISENGLGFISYKLEEIDNASSLLLEQINSCANRLNIYDYNCAEQEYESFFMETTDNGIYFISDEKGINSYRPFDFCFLINESLSFINNIGNRNTKTGRCFKYFVETNIDKKGFLDPAISPVARQWAEIGYQLSYLDQFWLERLEHLNYYNAYIHQDILTAYIYDICDEIDDCKNEIFRSTHRENKISLAEPNSYFFFLGKYIRELSSLIIKLDKLFENNKRICKHEEYIDKYFQQCAIKLDNLDNEYKLTDLASNDQNQFAGKSKEIKKQIYNILDSLHSYMLDISDFVTQHPDSKVICNPTEHKIYYPSKNIMFNYTNLTPKQVFCSEETTAVQHIKDTREACDAFVVNMATGNYNKCFHNVTKVNQVYHFNNDYFWYASKEGVSAVYFYVDWFSSKKKDREIKDVGNTEFILFLKSLYQSYTLLLFSDEIQKIVTANRNLLICKKTEDKKLNRKIEDARAQFENLYERLCVFQARGLESSVSYSEYPTAFYTYIKEKFRINQDVTSVIAGLDAMEDIIRIQKDKELDDSKDKRDLKVTVATAMLSTLVVISAFLDGHEFLGKHENIQGLCWIEIAIFIVFVVAFSIVVFGIKWFTVLKKKYTHK